MKSISAGLSTHISGRVTSLATLWKIVRTDAVEKYFTDHDQDITFSGDLYLAASGYKRSAVANQVGLSVDNLDIEGVFDGDQLDEDELRVGLYDYAEVFMMVINYTATADGVLKLRRGKLGEVAFTPQGFYKAELRGIAQLLSQNVIEMYTAECRADLGDSNCKIPILPDVLGREATVVVGEFYRLVTKSTTGIDWAGLGANMSFDIDAAGLSKTAITGWTVTSGEFHLHTSDGGTTPDDGVNFLGGGTGSSGSMEQSVTLADIGIDLTEVDAGNATADFSIRRANQTATADTGRVIVTFRDADGVIIGTPLDTTSEAISPEDTWATRSFTGTAIPTLTRSIKVQLSFTNVGGGDADTAFDNASLTVHETTTVNTFYDIYENRVYEVTTAGLTAVSQPTYDTVIGNPTTDGTAVLTARDSFQRDAYVDEVIDNRTLKIVVTEARAVDVWFDQGAIIFETTQNAGKVHEVRSWIQSTTQAVFFLPAPFTVLPGSKIRMYPGCDKIIGTCVSKFSNALNFRGEPYIPGQDSFQKFADVRS
jgi:uncharacterized phage protein (TIGR02218 family)